MEQNRKPRNKTIYVWSIYNGENTVSSISGAGKTGQLHVKEEIRTFYNIIYKTKLKMD